MSDVLMGVLAGFLAGIIPGLHINSLAGMLEGEALLAGAGAFLVSSIFQSLLYLTATPENVNALPLIARLKKAFGMKGVFVLHIVGVSVGLVASSFIYEEGIVSGAYASAKGIIPFLLLLSPLLLLWKSKNRKAFFFLMASAGVIGSVSMSLLEDPFFPLFSGLFAIPALLLSKKVEGSEGEALPKIEGALGSSLLGVGLGFLAALLPGISSPSVVSSVFFPFPLPYGSHISLFSSTMASQYVFAYGGYGETGKARVGWVPQAEGSLSLLVWGALGGTVLSIAVLFLKPNLAKFKWLVLAYLFLASATQGVAGVAVLAASSLLGVIAFRTEVEKTSLLGSIMLPVAAFYISPKLPL